MESQNFLSFLFGNVDANGQLENDDFDAEMKQTLAAGSAGLLDRFIQPSDLVSADDGAMDGAAVRPAKDAIDFGGIDEAVEDSSEDEALKARILQDSLRPLNKQPVRPVVASPVMPVLPVAPALPVAPPPDKILCFTELSSAPGLYDKPILGRTRTSIRRDAYISSSITRIKPSGPLLDDTSLFYSPSTLSDNGGRLFQGEDADEFRFKALLEAANGDVNTLGSVVETIPEEEEDEVDMEIITPAASNMDEKQEPLFHPVTFQDWESAILWDEECISTLTLKPAAVSTEKFPIPDYDLLIGDWVNDIIWDETSPALSREIPIEISLNDPNLVIDIVRPDSPDQTQQRLTRQQPKRPTLSAAAPAHLQNQNVPHPFNISNDRFYEVYRMHHRSGKLQRQNTSKSFLQHSLPALQLKLPFFRRYMSKADLRSFHRPAFRVVGGETMKFTRLKQLKNRKKLMKGQAITEILQDVEDITLKDNAPYVLFEYSEEYPPLLNNGGMGSMVINYYRKKEEKDPYIPKFSIGTPHILEQVDASPFFLFGQILPGETFHAIKNNLYIAPIFEHKLKNEDFLLIRYTPKSKRKTKKEKEKLKNNSSANLLPKEQPFYYIREIPKIFTVGQEFPISIIDPPQSRRIKLFIRDRLKVCALRRIKRRGRQAKYPIHHLVNSFHRYHDQSIRKHMKDFAEVIRGPDSTQFLKILPHVPIPSEQELQKMVNPEIVCVFESLRVGQQRLADIGYGSVNLNRGDDDSTDNQEDDAQLDDEIQLAPWHTTANFQLAAQQKGMIQVYGPGDPTGRGEGFSFFRFSMKEMFSRPGASRSEVDAYYQSQAKTGHKFSITDQQKIYVEELKKVWDRQRASLEYSADIELDHDEMRTISRSDVRNEHGMDADDEREWRDMMKMLEDNPSVSRTNGFDAGSSAAASPHTRRDADTHSVHSFSSKNVMSVKKALLIKRHINGHWVEEIVTDPHVIHPYLQQKRLLELSAFAGKNAINVEDDEETRKKKMKLMVKGMKKDSGISTAEVVKIAQATRAEESGASKRTCKSCGQLGHIKSNRICPDFARNFPDKAKKEAASDIKIVNGKMIIPTLAIKHAEESKTKKIENDKRKEEDKKRQAEEKAKAAAEAKKAASLKRAREAGTSSDEEVM